MPSTPFLLPTSNFAVEPHLVTDRIAIVEATIRVFQRLDYHEASYAAVAGELESSVDDITAHFPSWDGLVIATMERWMSGRQADVWEVALTRGAVPFLRELVKVNLAEPALTRLQLAILCAASNPNHPGHSFIRKQYMALYGYVQHALAQDITAHREPATMRPERGAEQLLALYEGLQVQAMMRDFDLLEAFDRAATRLRHSWAEEYTTPDLGWIV
jgi:AcrR family transcriptional regulator